MNTDTGHLVSGKLYQELLKEETKKEKVDVVKLTDLETGRQELLDSYEQVPKELEAAAKKKLAGKDETVVSLTSGGKLSKWAAKRRKDKRKLAKASRKKNR